MRVMSTFSGISAATVAWKPLGWEMVAYAEPAIFQAHVLHHRCGAGRPRYLPDGPAFDAKKYRDIPAEGTPNYGDITQITDEDLASLGPIDLLEGGPPCQAFSLAGLRLGLNDDRGNLSLAFVRLALRMRKINGLKYVLIENVRGILSHPHNPLGTIMGAFSGDAVPLVSPGKRWPDAGHVLGPDVEIAWRVLDSQHLGVAQRRARVYALVNLDPRSGVDPGEVLFEPEREGGRAGAGRETGQEHSGRPQAGARELTGADIRPFQQAGRTSAQEGSGLGEPGAPMYTLTADSPHGVLYPPLIGTLMSTSGASKQIDIEHVPVVVDTDGRHVVRRLMPVECERLQAFPDNWTLVPVRGRPAADAPRYRAIGNSITTKALSFVGSRLEAAIRDAA